MCTYFKFSKIDCCIFLSCGGIIWAPLFQYTLYPLSSLGLCEAVTITPANKRFSAIANGTNGVGTMRLYNQTGIPSFKKTHAESSANLIKNNYNEEGTIQLVTPLQNELGWSFSSDSPFAVVATIIAEYHSIDTFLGSWKTFQNVLGHTLSCLYNNQIIHRCETTSHNATQACGAKCQAFQQQCFQCGPIMLFGQRLYFITGQWILENEQKHINVMRQYEKDLIPNEGANER